MSTVETDAGPQNGIPSVTDFDPFDQLGFDFWKHARAEHPVFWNPQMRAYFLTRYADVDLVLGDRSGKISAEPALHPNIVPIDEAMQIMGESGLELAPSIVDEDGDEHKKHRRAAQPPFSPNNVKKLADFIRERVTFHLDDIVKTGNADLVDAMIYEVPGEVILHLMGVPDDQLAMVKGFRGPWAEFLWGLPNETAQIETAHGMAGFGQWARGIAQRSLDNPGDDIISVAVENLRALGIMEERNERLWLNSYTLNVVMAGHETTANTAAGGLVAILENRDQWEALVADPSLARNAADEILRYCSGVPTWRQRAVEDFELPTGSTIPAGALIYAAINSANRDEELFDDGERFDIQRANANKHITFGKGAHTCMGNHLAKLEITIMYEELTRRLPHIELAEQEYTFSPNTSQRGPEHVLCTWDPTKNPIEADRP